MWIATLLLYGLKILKGYPVIAPGLEPLATPVGDLKPLPGNPRRGDVDAVARSLARFGQRKPIVVRTDGTIIAGNHTWMAAKKLGWDEIAAVRVADDDTEAFAFALADNRTAELGGYDPDALAEMLNEVAGSDAFAATGYTQADLDALAAEIAPPPLPEPGDADIEDLPAAWGVIIECSTEGEQVELLQRFGEEGLRVRAVMG